MALVSLGEGGIGTAVALAFAREGADLAIVYFNDHRGAEETRQRALLEGVRCILLSGNATSEAFCRFAVRKALSTLGRLAARVPQGGALVHQVAPQAVGHVRDLVRSGELAVGRLVDAEGVRHQDGQRQEDDRSAVHGRGWSMLAPRGKLDPEVTAPPPETPVTIPAGVRHHFCNDGDKDAVAIQEFRPAQRTQQFFDSYFDLAERDDILSLLLQASHEDGSPMSDIELRDELVTLLVAGHETTATALAWAVERLVHHPDKLERLTEEVQDGGTEYLDAVVTETLRLRPVISAVARRLTEPVELGGWELPAGVSIQPSIYLVHRRPDVYPEPERFVPERFLDHPPGTYTWIPFGGGVRRCLGGAFAMFEMNAVLTELVRRRRIEAARAEPEPVLRRAITETPRRNAEVIVR